MLDSSRMNRIKFKRQKLQQRFITEAKNAVNLKWSQLAKKLNIHPRTLADWKREKFAMSYIVAQELSQLSGIPIPQPYKIIEWKDHLRTIGIKGGTAKFNKYGAITSDEEYRAQKWREWWDKIGQYKKPPDGFSVEQTIKFPEKNEALAEYVGIMLGDGGIAPYHVSVTLSNKETAYAKYVRQLITDLFGVVPKIYFNKLSEALNIVVQRKQLVKFCQGIGLVLGNKVRQQVDIPEWIKENNQFILSCLKGLIDTDGCFYKNSYVVNRKHYEYLKIAFSNASLPLIYSVTEALKKIGINARICRHLREVRIEAVKDVTLYVQKVGSHNEKHLKKIEKWSRVGVV